MLPSRKIEILEYLDRSGHSPYARWFDSLAAEAAAQVAVALTRLEQGNVSGIKGLGRGLYEYRIHFGPGLRIYLGKDGERLVILLGGGTCLSLPIFAIVQANQNGFDTRKFPGPSLLFRTHCPAPTSSAPPPPARRPRPPNYRTIGRKGCARCDRDIRESRSFAMVTYMVRSVKFVAATGRALFV